MSSTNLEQLITAAQLLRPLLDELVFIGGAVTGLLQDPLVQRHHIPKCPLMDPPAHRRSFARIPS